MKLDIINELNKICKIFFVLPCISICFFNIIWDRKFLSNLFAFLLSLGIILIGINKKFSISILLLESISLVL